LRCKTKVYVEVNLSKVYVEVNLSKVYVEVNLSKVIIDARFWSEHHATSWVWMGVDRPFEKLPWNEFIT
jgi:hypothetical protein